MALAYGVFAAGVVQLLFQIPFLGKVGAIPRIRWRPDHPGVKRAGRLMLPALFGSSVAQINVLLGSVIASVLGVGKISYIYYSDRLMEFPLGLFGIALATVTLPYLSRQAATESAEQFSSTVDWSLKLVMLLAVPSAIGLACLADALVATIYYGGEFSAKDLEMTAISLQAFAFGLIGFSLVKIFAPAFFAREDTKTPVKIGIVALVVNVVLSLAFAYTIASLGYDATHAGLALATSIAAIVNAGLLYRGLWRDGVVRHARDWVPFAWRLAGANLALLLVLLVLDRPVTFWLTAGMAAKIGWLALSVLGGTVVYFAALGLLGARPRHLKLRRS